MDAPNRRARLWSRIEAPLDALVLADPANLVYFANYAPSPFVFRSCDARAVLILTRDRATLVADKMVQTYLAEAHVDDVVAPVWYDGKHAAPHRQALVARAAREVLARLAPARLGIESASVPAGLLEGIETADAPVSLDATIRAQRRVKDPDELALFLRSVRAGEAGHAAALAQIRPGMSELDAYLLVADACNRADASQVLVYGDFASGPRVISDRGGPPTSRLIESGDLFLLDYSVVVRGYRADFTNTWVVDGRPTDDQRRLFDACLAALASGESALRAGTIGRDVDAAVRRPLRERGLEDALKSHSGHGLGLSHPEPPYLVAESDDVLLAGDIVALEPGLFIPGVGGMRFEHNYLVQNDGFERLTNHRLTLTP